MKKMKKALAVLSTAAVISMFTVPAFAAQNETNIQFIDINGHWAKNDILDLVRMGLLKGMGNNKFEPNTHVSREQFASMISRTFHLKNQSTVQDFEDVAPTRWSFNTIEASKDYMDAFRSLDGSALDFHPTDNIDRQDVTMTFVKVLMKYNSSWTLPDQASAEQFLQQTFTDAADIAPALQPYIAVAVQKNLVHGDKNGKFAPERNLTRGEVAALLRRVIKMGLDVVVPSDMNNPTPVPVTPAPSNSVGTNNETVPSNIGVATTNTGSTSTSLPSTGATGVTDTNSSPTTGTPTTTGTSTTPSTSSTSTDSTGSITTGIVSNNAGSTTTTGTSTPAQTNTTTVGANSTTQTTSNTGTVTQ